MFLFLLLSVVTSIFSCITSCESTTTTDVAQFKYRQGDTVLIEFRKLVFIGIVKKIHRDTMIIQEPMGDQFSTIKKTFPKVRTLSVPVTQLNIGDVFISKSGAICLLQKRFMLANGKWYMVVTDNFGMEYSTIEYNLSDTVKYYGTLTTPLINRPAMYKIEPNNTIIGKEDTLHYRTLYGQN